MLTPMTEDEAKTKADRLVKKLQDALGPEYRDMIASHGGAEAYLRWVRGYDDPPSDVEIWQQTGKLPDGQ
jgi:hypothetical protein